MAEYKQELSQLEKHGYTDGQTNKQIGKGEDSDRGRRRERHTHTHTLGGHGDSSPVGGWDGSGNQVKRREKVRHSGD